jgi:hypothetical protein
MEGGLSLIAATASNRLLADDAEPFFDCFRLFDIAIKWSG